MTDFTGDRPILIKGLGRCPECPPREVTRPTYEGPEIEVDRVKFHAVGWLDSRFLYREGAAPALPPPPRPRPSDALDAWFH